MRRSALVGGVRRATAAVYTRRSGLWYTRALVKIISQLYIMFKMLYPRDRINYLFCKI